MNTDQTSKNIFTYLYLVNSKINFNFSVYGFTHGDKILTWKYNANITLKEFTLNSINCIAWESNLSIRTHK